MQSRMKNHILAADKIEKLLAEAQVASLAMINLDGSPYVVPVHFVYHNEVIYIHGLPKGQKIDNILADSRVSLLVYRMDGYLFGSEDNPCEVNTHYQSVIIAGNAALVEDLPEKKLALTEIVCKYTPQLTGGPIPENMLKATAVVKITISELTGKYYE